MRACVTVCGQVCAWRWAYRPELGAVLEVGDPLLKLGNSIHTALRLLVADVEGPRVAESEGGDVQHAMRHLSYLEARDGHAFEIGGEASSRISRVRRHFE